MFKPNFDKYLENIWNNYSKDPAKMLVHTGTIGWALSSAAQITAILFNDKISAKEKTFLIPQETFDAVVNIGSFYLLTTGIKNFSKKLVTTGKILPKSIKNYMENSPFKHSYGKGNFNMEKDLTPLTSFESHKKQYTAFKNIFTTGATIGASILSCNIVTPVLRNELASISHKTIVNRANEGTSQILTKEDINNKDSKALQIKYKPALYNHHSGGLKV